MSNEKQLDLCLCSLFGFSLLIQLFMYFDSTHIVYTALTLLAAVPTAYISLKRDVFQNAIGRIGAILTACILIFCSNPFDFSFSDKVAHWMIVILAFLLGLSGAAYLIYSKTSKSIKIFGCLEFIGVIVLGTIVSAMLEKEFENLSQFADFFMLFTVVFYFIMFMAGIALILAIVRLCKPVEEERAGKEQDILSAQWRRRQ